MKEFSSLFNELGEKVSFEKGEKVFSSGEKADAFYYVEKGSVEIFISEENKEKILAVLREGEILGEMTLFEDAPRSADVRAKEDSVLVEVKKEKFYSFMKESPEKAFLFTRKIVNIISSRLRIMNSFLVEIFNFSMDLFKVKTEQELSHVLIGRIVKCVKSIEKGLLFFWNKFNQEYEVSLHYNWDGDFPSFSEFNEEDILKFFNRNNSYVFSLGREKIVGFLYIESKKQLKEEEKILISTLSYLSSPVLMNIWYNEEQANIERLKRNKGI